MFCQRRVEKAVDTMIKKGLGKFLFVDLILIRTLLTSSLAWTHLPETGKVEPRTKNRKNLNHKRTELLKYLKESYISIVRKLKPNRNHQNFNI